MKSSNYFNLGTLIMTNEYGVGEGDEDIPMES